MIDLAYIRTCLYQQSAKTIEILDLWPGRPQNSLGFKYRVNTQAQCYGIKLYRHAYSTVAYL